MRVVDSLVAAARQGVEGAVISIGNFDGVHLGHRALLARMGEVARERGRPSVVVSFFPPAKVFFSEASYLSSSEEKLMLLREFGPDLTVLIPFNQQFSRTTAAEFLRDVARLAPNAFVVGPDFRFGQGRAGSTDDLASLAPLEEFPLVREDGVPVGSTRIRQLLEAGDVSAANRLLGAPYPALGEVVRGAQRGATLGFPTANLQLEAAKALPPGVFAVTAQLEDRSDLVLGGMANVGARPSFEDQPPSLEVHLFDFSGDIYGRRLLVRFVGRLRDQVKFGSLDELKAQLGSDERAARQLLARA